MAVLRIYNDIVDEQERVLMRDYGIDGVCYKDIQEFLSNMNNDDDRIDIRIHCSGGDCVEGWAIYDALRTSKKTISATIEGDCSSMATIILMAAPLERRFAYQNAHICIHNPAAVVLDIDYCERLTADNIDKSATQLRNQAETLRLEQKRMVDLYVNRTNAKRAELQALMDKDVYIDTDRAIDLGFISKTIVPNTAKRNNNNKSKNQSMKKTFTKVANTTMNRLLAKAGLKSLDDLKMVDQVITAADGTELTVEREEGDPQIGDTAYPDGSYVLESGTTITVAGEVIVAITEPDDNTGEGDGSDNDDETTVEELQNEIETLENRVQTLENENEGLRSQVVSDADRQIIAKVNKAGGAAWLDKVLGMRSTYTASNRRFVEHNDNAGETKTQRAIRLQKENAAKRRNAAK